MLRGETEALRIEDPGVDKAEFVVTIGSRCELHQVKRSHPSGKWSLASLRADGLLRALGSQLAGNDDRFVFASGSDARELGELCEAARDAESTAEFEHVFLAATDRNERFEKVCREWACDAPTVIDRLRRIDVRTIGEPELERKVRWAIPALFLANPDAVIQELRGIVEDSVHRTISRQALVEDLARRGYRLRRLLSPENASVTLESATDRYLDGARSRLIRGKLVPTTAAGTLLSRLDGAATDSVATGRAGSGKTACVVEVVQGLRARGMPVFAFRLDRIPLSSVSTTEALGRDLDLEESPVLVLTAAAEAVERPGVLIVDQLDAVSTMSGRSSAAFDLVEQLLREAREMRTRAVIHTVIVCRAFDWQNDSRLRRLMPPNSQAPVELDNFTVEEVKAILVGGSFDAALFRENQLQILRLPQNLSLFLESGSDLSCAPAFRTETELFARYWKKKRKWVACRAAPSPDQWAEVMEILCNEMTSTQQLSVPMERLDRIPTAYLEQVASEGVLIFDGRRYGFGHESFFDYCVARLFVSRQESLASFLKTSEQLLSRRAQVRQVLVYLRDTKSAKYKEEIRSLLSDKGIRRHIKDLAFALLADVTEPTDEEWTVWEGWTEPALKAIEEGIPNPDKFSALAWRRFFESASWFVFADRRGMVEGWLTSGSDHLAEMAVDYVGIHHRHSPDRAACLLQPYAESGGRWQTRLRIFMQQCELHKSRRLFDLFLQLVDNGTLDEARNPRVTNGTFWDILYGLYEYRVEWLPEVLAHRLRRRFSFADASDEDSKGIVLPDDGSPGEAIFRSAGHVPREFVKHVLPVVLEISDSICTGDEPPKRDAVWSCLFSKYVHLNGDHECLAALADTLAALAGEGSMDLHGVLGELRRRETYAANLLLLNLYAGGAVRYADDAVAAFCEEPWRFECGFSDSPHWCAREAIAAVMPHCTVEARERIECAILDYVPPYERTKDGYQLRGSAQFALLSAIPEDMRSLRANARFRELERKFGEPKGGPYETLRKIFEPPSMDEAAEKKTDGQWLRAIMRYRSDAPIHYSSDGATGGAWQLAQLLEKRAKEEPERFARLSLRFPLDANPAYLERTLVALKSVSVASDLKLQVCRKAFEESREHCGPSIADVIGSIEDPLPDEAVEMLHWLATEHEDPVEEAWKMDSGGGRTHYNGDIYTNGINTTRGRAAIAVWDIILRDAVYVERFRSTLERMVRDPSASVLSCVAGTLRAVAFHDPVFAMGLFRRMNLSEERLLATPHVYGFMRDRLRDSFGDLRSLIERKLRSVEPGVCEAGAGLAGFAFLEDQDAVDLVDEALRGGPHHLLGIAQVASANIAIPECRNWSEEKLVALFNDDDAGVRDEAAKCFGQLKGEDLETYSNLIAVFCDSKAFREDSFRLLQTLEESPGRLPGMTCLVCEKFLDRFAEEAKDIRTHRAADGYTLTKLVFRTYQQHQNDEWTSRSLDLIDRLCLEGIGDATRELEQFDR